MYKSQRFDLIMILIMEILLHNVYKPYLNRLPNLIPRSVKFFMLCLVSCIANHDSYKENIFP